MTTEKRARGLKVRAALRTLGFKAAIPGREPGDFARKKDHGLEQQDGEAFYRQIR